MVVLEAREAAEARGAEVLGVVRGWGMSSDGEGDMVAPSSDGARRAIEAALAHAGLSPDAIDYVNTHGTSTPAGDVTEVRAIRSVLGDRHVAYSSTKGYTGHTVSAAGAIEAIFTMAMLRGGWVAPSINATAARSGAGIVSAGRRAHVAPAPARVVELVWFWGHQRDAGAVVAFGVDVAPGR